jgi:hypothetical protein
MSRLRRDRLNDRVPGDRHNYGQRAHPSTQGVDLYTNQYIIGHSPPQLLRAIVAIERSLCP